MSASEPTASSAMFESSVFERLVKRVFLRNVEITGVEDVSETYRLVEIGGEALKGLSWRPGNQIQIGVGPKFANRAYTPIDWDTATGRLRFLAYLHSDTPGCNWLRSALPGQPCDILGPKRSLELAPNDGAPLLFGDETCLGLARAFRGGLQGAAARFIFEVGNVVAARAVLARLDIGDALLVERLPDGSHLHEAARVVLAASERHESIVLAGKAQSIQAVKSALKTAGIDQRRVKAKAYWAPGKVGMD